MLGTPGIQRQTLLRALDDMDLVKIGVGIRGVGPRCRPLHNRYYR